MGTQPAIQSTSSFGGYFIDWNGDTRRVDAPGPTYSCLVGALNGRIGVQDSQGCIIHEADHWASLDDLKTAGISINLVPEDALPSGQVTSKPLRTAQ